MAIRDVSVERCPGPGGVGVLAASVEGAGGGYGGLAVWCRRRMGRTAVDVS